MALAKQELRALIGRAGNDDRADSQIWNLAMATAPDVRPETLELAYPTLSTRLEPESGVLWAWMRHPRRACFTPELMADGRHFQTWLQDAFGDCTNEDMPFRYLVWGSRAAGAWSMGGDLSTFTRLIRAQDRDALRAYAYRSVEVLYDNYRSLELPILTAALLQGDAIGGGFEAILTMDLVVAERGTKFGLPEVLFNLFPGMGAYSFLRRRLDERTARLLIEDGRTRTAEEMHELGLVHVLAEPGQGERVLRETLAAREGRFRLDLALKRVRLRVDAITRAELFNIVDEWVELALELPEDSLRRMDCLARHQERRRAAAKSAVAA